MKHGLPPALLVVVSLLAHSAHAHSVGLSRGDYRRDLTGLHVELTFARAELASLSPAGRAATGAELKRAVFSRMAVTCGDGSATLEHESAESLANDGVQLSAHYGCSKSVPMTVRLALLSELAHGHRHAARVLAADYHDEGLYFAQNREFVVPALASPAASGASSRRSWWGFLLLGGEHILSGGDHVLFVLALLLPALRLRSLLKIISAFTVGHSLSLALAAFGYWRPSPALIEPAIALSIVYVGFENLSRANAERRWLVTLPFGLIHGFGFAGVLEQVQLPEPGLLPALACFNLGVELGQLALVALALPCIQVLRNRRWFARRALPCLSAFVIAIGLCWFATRVRDALPERAGIDYQAWHAC